VISTLAVAGFRSLRDVVVPLGDLTVFRGANGVGKSSLYQAFGLLADVADGRLIGSLARAGGLESVLWAGPEAITSRMRSGEVPVQGQVRRSPVSLQLGFAGDEFGYLVDIGLPRPGTSLFARDPEIKREAVWSGPVFRPAAALVERRNGAVRTSGAHGWESRPDGLGPRQSVLAELADPRTVPELAALRHGVRSWRFYDHFRIDPGSPARAPQVGTWSPVLDHDGANLAAAVQSILESGQEAAFATAVDSALPGTRVAVESADGWFQLRVRQPGLLRPLSGAEISDGTLRYLLLATALLSPTPPPLLVLNEPESSLHPRVLPALAELIAAAAARAQVVVVTHSEPLVAAVRANGARGLVENELAKDTGETVVVGQEGLLDRPGWAWGAR
jgi:predicted ATPase